MQSSISITKFRRKKVSSRKKAINSRNVPRTKQISEILRIPAPIPETVDLEIWVKIVIPFLIKIKFFVLIKS